jgi:hypothetical protein
MVTPPFHSYCPKKVEFDPMHFPKLLAVAAVTLVASVAGAQAQQVQAGVLECHGGPNVGYVVGSSAEMECVFRSNTGAPPEPYIAHIQRFGLDLSATSETGLAWVVNAPSHRIGRGALAGHFGGVGANATAGVGIGANLLVGGSDNSISLQPLSLQGQTGFSAVAGIVDVDLRPADVRGPRHHYPHRHHHRRHHHRHHR